jgi:hypothetical protein
MFTANMGETLQDQNTYIPVIHDSSTNNWKTGCVRYGPEFTTSTCRFANLFELFGKPSYVSASAAGFANLFELFGKSSYVSASSSVILETCTLL